MSAPAGPGATASPWPPVRDELAGMQPYGAPQLDVPVRLNTNENPYPPPAALVADLVGEVAEIAGTLNRYPDRDARELRAALAAYLTDQTGVAVDAAQVWAANGSNEVLVELLQAFAGPGRSVLAMRPGYSMVPELARTTGSRLETLDLPVGQAPSADALVAAIGQARPDVVLIASPNNPTGQSVALEALAAAADALDASDRGLLIVDEAYGEFSQQASAVTLLAGHRRLVVTRTMSKAFAFAGARLGYLAAAPEIVEAVQLVRLPYHLSALTQAAALAALRHSEALTSELSELKASRDAMTAHLRSAGLPVLDSDANFVLFGGLADQGSVWQWLLDEGVLVRDVGLAGWLRVTAGTAEQTQAFLGAVDRVLVEHPECRAVR